MNYRGIEVELATSRTYCATNFDDVDMVVKHVHKKYPEHKIMTVGVSLGGLKLGGYLAKQYDDCLISNALIVSSPMNLFSCSRELEKRHNYFIFNRFITKQLGNYFEKYI